MTTALTEYETLAASIDVLRMDYQAARNCVIPPEVQDDLNAIDAEFNSRLSEGERRLEAAKKLAQDECKAAGATISGSLFNAVYKQGSWAIADLTGLLAYAASGHPEVMGYLKKGAPSAAITPRR